MVIVKIKNYQWNYSFHALDITLLFCMIYSSQERQSQTPIIIIRQTANDISLQTYPIIDSMSLYAK